jgi:hypothetical protein
MIGACVLIQAAVGSSADVGQERPEGWVGPSADGLDIQTTPRCTRTQNIGLVSELNRCRGGPRISTGAPATAPPLRCGGLNPSRSSVQGRAWRRCQ